MTPTQKAFLSLRLPTTRTEYTVAFMAIASIIGSTYGMYASLRDGQTALRSDVAHLTQKVTHNSSQIDAIQQVIMHGRYSNAPTGTRQGQ